MARSPCGRLSVVLWSVVNDGMVRGPVVGAFVTQPSVLITQSFSLTLCALLSAYCLLDRQGTITLSPGRRRMSCLKSPLMIAL